MLFLYYFKNLITKLWEFKGLNKNFIKFKKNFYTSLRALRDSPPFDILWFIS